MNDDQISVAQESYDRCCADPDFFSSFYELLLASSPEIPPMFAQTDFEKQNRLLRHAIGLLLIYARRRNPALLQRIAERHGPTDVNVSPTLYPLWVDSLIAAVKRHDSAFSASVEEAWRAAVAPGIDFLTSKYGES